VTLVSPYETWAMSSWNLAFWSVHLTIKDLEGQHKDASLVLNTFIVSNTPVSAAAWCNDGMTKDEFEAWNVLFQQEDRATYIEKLLGKVAIGG